MGVAGLARWTNAPTSGLEMIKQNIMRNHQGQYRGKWQLSVKSYRSNLNAAHPAFQFPVERNMCALTMNENVFVLLEDPTAPTRGDILHQAGGEPSQAQAAALLAGPPHYRNTFLTLSPPGALEQLLAHLKARWVPVRQTSGSNTAQRGQNTGQQLFIDGHIFSIGTDWLVRAGNVILAGGAVKGMLLEAEYLPLPLLHTSSTDGTSELLSNLLTSVLPNIPDAKTVAVTISDQQWEEVLWNREDEEQKSLEQDKMDVSTDGVFVSGTNDIVKYQKGDWTGVDRDRRSAFLIIGALKSEGIL